MIDVLDLFSAAAGGWSLGMHRAGYRTLAACEVEAWRRAVYSENNPGVKVYDDVRTLTAARLLGDHGRLPAIVVGSPPCQDISSANTKGRGVEGERSGLYFEAIRIIGEVRPRWFALENSANLRTRGADAVIAALEGIDYASWPLVVRAGDVGANHERPRCWIIGCDLEQVGHAGFGPVGAFVGVHERPSPDGAGGRPDDAAVRDAHAIPHAHASCAGSTGGCAVRPRRKARDQHARNDEPAGARSMGGVDASHSNEARQAHGRVEPGLRQAEIANDGRCAGWSADGPSTGQVGLCPPDRGHTDRSGPDWSLEHFADHLRVDDGLSAWLAGTRVQVGDGKGQSAASLVVEAFGDAVIPQIPEAIGRAIWRVERAMTAITERQAA